MHHVDLDAGPTSRTHFTGGAGQTRGPHILHADEGVGLHQLEAGLEQQLLHERIAHLHRRAFLRGLLVEFRGCHRRAVNAVASGLRANVIDRIADARRASFHQGIRRRNAEAHDVDQGIAGVCLLEGNLATDRRNADAVAVPGNAGHDSLDDAACGRALIAIHRAEPQ